jgi:DNA-directed RNA polymerase subunit M/transcription elongation factor TFIIS
VLFLATNQVLIKQKMNCPPSFLEQLAYTFTQNAFGPFYGNALVQASISEGAHALLVHSAADVYELYTSAAESVNIPTTTIINRDFLKTACVKYFQQARERVVNSEETFANLGAAFCADAFIRPTKNSSSSCSQSALISGKEYLREISEMDWCRRGPEFKASFKKCKNKKCGSRNIQSSDRQTRSADEPMSTENVCLDCGTQWRTG